MEDAARRAIAIVGVGAILPDAPDAGQFWRNIVESRYSIGDVDPGRWDPERYYDPDPAAPDKTYSKIGGWVRDWEWEPMRWRLPIPPKVADSMDDAQKWAVACARAALADYGHPERPLELERTAVVLGSAMAGEQHYETSLRIQFPEYAAALAEAPGFAALPEEARRTIREQWHERIAAATPPITEDTMPGELANCMAGRITNLFDLHGPNFVCDAACASALAAIDAAMEGLVENEYDAVLAGGVDRNMGASTYVKFCKIGALSATGTRPYADGADGFVMGEGAAFFVLKRLADAEGAGDRIYAVLRGMGGASDGRGKGITAPNPVGQQLAIERAWRTAGVSPAAVGLIEGHGTSTRVGDVVELQSLDHVFGGVGLRPGSIPLGSVKSNIGHLKGAAGAAGLLKAVFALSEKVLPPSLNFEKPNPNVDWQQTPFFVNTETKPWDAPANGVRTAAVSAFGFGGTNFHAVLEEYVPGRLTSRGTSVSVPGASEIRTVDLAELKTPVRGALVLGAETPAALRGRLDAIRTDAEAGRAPAPAAPQESDLRAAERIAIDYGDAAELATRAQRAGKALDGDQPAAWRALRAQGIHRGHGSPGKVAFLYTGQGSQYANMLRDLRDREPIVADTFAEADRVMADLLDRPLSEYIFVDPEDAEAVARCEADLRRTEITQPAVLAVDAALTRMLEAYGIAPDMVMGHSLGEYGALVASGALPFEDAVLAVSARGRGMANLSIPDQGKMAAVFAPLAEVEALLADIPGNVVIANVNSGSQAVVGGASEAVDAAVAAFEAREMKAIPLPVSHAFHTSIVAPASEPLREALSGLRLAPPRVPLVGNVEGDFYPSGSDAVERMLDLLAAQVASPVQFVKGLETLHAAGARVLVEIGPKSALHGFAQDVLGQRPGVVTLFTNHPKTGDFATFNSALCGLYAAGLGRGAAARDTRPAEVTSMKKEVESAAAAASAGPLSENRYAELGRLFADVLERGARILGQGEPAPAAREPCVVTGAALGLPGHEQVFDDDHIRAILDGEQGIDVIPGRFRQAMVDKHITRLVKSESEGAHFETIEGPTEAIKLAARAGRFDLQEEFGVPAERIPALDVVTRLAMGAGLDALRDAGIPLVQHYRTTSKGTKIPERWMLPDALRDDTAVIFASAFPGFDSYTDELTRYYEDRGRRRELEHLETLRARLDDGAEASDVLRAEIDHRLHALRDEVEAHPYAFDRRFLFRVLAMGHSQFAEYIGARGPNTHINSACASTTQAFALAEDWIRAGRCRRVVVVAGDDVTSDRLLEWVGAGFLSSGAAATDEDVESAALPFDRRRHGMILGMGAAGFVIEHASCARERGLRPICEVLATETANSAFHGTRLDVAHIVGLMEKLVAGAERRFRIDRQELARQLVFVSHETYTPARGGSASAEVNALRTVFGDGADQIVVANTKGLTGHPMGVGIEDAVAVKILETGLVPPVPNFQEPDPDLGPLHLSKGGAYPVRYALRLGAGFGSQISMSLLRWTPTPDGHRPDPDELGYASRLSDSARWSAWLAEMSGDAQAEVEIVKRTLRVRDRGPAARAEAAPLEPPMVKAPGVPLATQPEPHATPAAPSPATAEPAVDPILTRVLAIVAEKTGYPVDMLDPELDLEADLGIDTVKQAETFAALREAWDIPRDETLKLRDYPTLGHAVGFVRERRPDLAAAPPATPAPAEAPAPQASAAAPGGDDPILARVLAIVAEKTGYPVDMLDPELDLEADLGIDTVKQAETFAALREAWDIPRDETLKLRDYPTLGHAVGFVRERRPDLAEAAPATPAPAEAPAPQASAAAPGGDDPILARVLAIVAEKTGYPVDMLDPELDLEADLGIDTVKQAETFAAIREAWDIPRDETLQLRDYPTLGHTVGFVRERRPDLAAAPPATPAPAEAPAPQASAAAPGGDDPILARVLAIVAEKTGYPVDMLDPELDLEADLGIDTVKQAETFAAIREAWDIPRDETLQLRDYPTLGHTVGFVRERRPDLAEAASAEPTTTTASAEPAAASEAEPTAGEGAPAVLPRRVPVPVLRPPLGRCRASGVELGVASRVVLMHDAGGVGRELASQLQERGVEVLSLENVTNSEDLLARAEEWLAAGAIQGIYWLPALDAAGELGDLDLPGWRAALQVRVKLLYTLARHLYEELAEAGAFLVSGTRLGGLHGYDANGAGAPLGGAVVGFTKALARERPDTLVKAVDFPADWEPARIAQALIEESLHDAGCVEVGRVGEDRWSLALAEEPAADGGPGLELTSDSVFVVTGAAGGIVSAITADLATASGGTFHLLDVVPEPDADDADLALFASDRDALRRKIFERLREAGQRGTPVEVERALAGLERGHAALSALRAVAEAGGRAIWHCVDLTDSEAVAKAIETVTAEHGHVDVLLHAAGLERSRSLPDKDPAEFDLVFDVKCDGWFNLMHALGDTPLAAAVVFSSIAGRFGNAGQADYSAANDLLCKQIASLRRTHPDTRGIAIDWTAWGDVGMATRGSIPELMARAGIDMLPAAEGIPIVRRELCDGARRGEVLVAGALGVLLEERAGFDPDAAGPEPTLPLVDRIEAWSLQGGVTASTRLDPSRQPFLGDHRIEGTAVLPGVMGLEGFVELAGSLGGGRNVKAIEDVRFLAPFKFYRDEPRELAWTVRMERRGSPRIARCALVGSRTLVGRSEPESTTHFTASVRLCSNPWTEPSMEAPPSTPTNAVLAEDIYRVYFHGPAFQVLDSVWRTEDLVIGRLNPKLPPLCQPSDVALAAAPRLVELCFQTAGVWEIGTSGRMGLPQQIACVWLAPDACEGNGVRYAVVSPNGDGSFDADVVDEAGRTLVRLEGYATALLPTAVDDALRAPLRKAMD